MKKILWLVCSLTAIAAVCAGVLAYVDSITKGPIAEMKVKQAQAAAAAVMPAVGEVEKLKVEGLKGVAGAYVGTVDGKVVGYAVTGRDGKGYGGDIVLMVGFKADKKTVVSYKKLEANETPGLGAKLSSPEFADQFKGVDASQPIKVAKSGGKIQAITSATITSKAVCRAVNDAQKKLK